MQFKWLSKQTPKECIKSYYDSSADALLSYKYPQKALITFFISKYLMRELQKCARNLMLTVPFLGQTKAGEKIAAKGAGLAVLSYS